jgi:polyhydroxyalkanoate synthesis repressor PhaR
MPAQSVIIKKYENRRLYDSTNSRYVNLEEIAQMVRDGIDVQVIDAASGEDLTRLVLTQIIAENAKVADSAFPVDMLRQMVIASGKVGRDGVLGYVKAMSEMYQNTFRAFAAGPVPFDFAAQQTSDAAHTAQADKGPTVEELRRRVEDLERMVEQNAKGAAKAKRSAKKGRK